jgi:hypothetical protein
MDIFGAAGLSPAQARRFIATRTSEDATTQRWIETVLANDESSTDEQLVSYFVVNGLTEDHARELVKRRLIDFGKVTEPSVVRLTATAFHVSHQLDPLTGQPWEPGERPASLALKCRRCGHTWLRRNLDKLPNNCAKCKSPYWNRPRLTGK